MDSILILVAMAVIGFEIDNLKNQVNKVLAELSKTEEK